ncbi:MAG: sulfate ABC transporter permease, partial [Limisphaerales bacterium]
MGIRVENQQRASGGHRGFTRGGRESPWVKWILVGCVGVFLSVFLVIPLVNVFAQALGKGIGAYVGAITHPDTVSSIRLTLLTAAICVPLNLVLGVCAAWSVAKFEFPGKTLLITLIDLPFSVSPVVAGLSYLVLFGLQGYLGPWLADRDLQVVFAVPGIVLATLFVTFPLVARELIPVMQATGTDAEQAAMTLGASGWQTFWRVTLPS